MSGGFSGQVSVYGLPSGRLMKVIPVFSQDPEEGWGYDEESKGMLQTSFGFVPWDDAHHPELSQTNGVPNGKWLFINGNNTPASRGSITSSVQTQGSLDSNSAGNHSSPFDARRKYVVAGRDSACRFKPRRVDRRLQQNFKGNNRLSAPMSPERWTSRSDLVGATTTTSATPAKACQTGSSSLRRTTPSRHTPSSRGASERKKGFHRGDRPQAGRGMRAGSKTKRLRPPTTRSMSIPASPRRRRRPS